MDKHLYRFGDGPYELIAARNQPEAVGKYIKTVGEESYKESLQLFIETEGLDKEYGEADFLEDFILEEDEDKVLAGWREESRVDEKKKVREWLNEIPDNELPKYIGCSEY
jgi:hypothetical protein